MIDHLLAMPVVQRPICLKQPKVQYTFADPEQEKLSEGRKSMLRTGDVNAGRVRARLTDIRAAVTGQPWLVRGAAAPVAVAPCAHNSCGSGFHTHWRSH